MTGMHGMYTERNRYMVLGGAGLVILIAFVAIGIKDAFDIGPGYELEGRFAAAGQGLIEGSDVKIRGVNVGEVADIELVDNRALVTMQMHNDVDVPVDATATIRAKTLFGEKFIDIDPGDDEVSGPFLDDGDEIADTLGGFELERVLADTYPVLQAIDGAELATVLDELAAGAEGLGSEINRSIVNSATLTELQASNDAEFRQFLGDLALLSEQLDASAPELVALAENLNDSLPTLNARSDELNQALVQLARVSGDVADLLEANEEFTTNALTDGSTALQVIHDARERLQPTVEGAIKYLQLLAESIRIEASDGTLMAAVKNILSISELTGLDLSSLQSATASAPATTSTQTTTTAPVPVPSSGSGLDDLTREILGLFGGGS